MDFDEVIGLLGYLIYSSASISELTVASRRGAVPPERAL